MKNKIVISMAFFFVLGISSLFFLPVAAENFTLRSRILPTYFGYRPQEINYLKHLSSTHSISEESLKKWDKLATHIMSVTKISYYERVRFFTYLYGAQRDAAFLSYNTHEHFEGSLDPISFAIFQQFFPEIRRPMNFTTDVYSEKLSAIVFSKFNERFKHENTLSLQYEITGNGGYDVPVPQSIADCAKWIPWLVRPVTIYFPETPPAMDDKVWAKEIQEVKNAQKNITEKERQKVYYWAGLKGPGSGDWIFIVNQFLFQNKVPIAKIFLVRSIFTMGLYDTIISYLNAKYRYAVMRPNVRDPAIIPLIPVPSHPSYPSGHSTEGTVTKMMMTYFFPEEKKNWDNLAEEAGMSRIWAGVHYPIDHVAGKKLGKLIGDQILYRLCEQEPLNQRSFQNVRAVPAIAH